jgi:hypothetical protein
MFRVRKISLAAGLSAIALFMLVGAAGAVTTTTTVGQNFPPNGCVAFSNFTALQTKAVGTPYQVGTPGELVSWSFQTGSTPVPGLKLKVARPEGASFRIIGQAVAGTQVLNSINTYSAGIAVQAGDVIGIYFGAGSAPCAKFTGDPSDEVQYLNGDPGLGVAATPFSSGTGRRFPVSANLVWSSTATNQTEGARKATQAAAKKCKKKRSKKARKRCLRRARSL